MRENRSEGEFKMGMLLKNQKRLNTFPVVTILLFSLVFSVGPVFGADDEADTAVLEVPKQAPVAKPRSARIKSSRMRRNYIEHDATDEAKKMIRIRLGVGYGFYSKLGSPKAGLRGALDYLFDLSENNRLGISASHTFGSQNSESISLTSVGLMWNYGILKRGMFPYFGLAPSAIVLVTEAPDPADDNQLVRVSQAVMGFDAVIGLESEISKGLTIGIRGNYLLGIVTGGSISVAAATFLVGMSF